VKGKRAPKARGTVGVECGEEVWGGGVPLPPDRGLGRVLYPSPDLKKFGSKWAIFCSKNFCIQAKNGGGHSPVSPPKYVTVLLVSLSDWRGLPYTSSS